MRGIRKVDLPARELDHYRRSGDPLPRCAFSRVTPTREPRRPHAPGGVREYCPLLSAALPNAGMAGPWSWEAALLTP